VFHLDGEEYLVLSTPLRNSADLADLTAAERAVLALAVRGATNVEIARARRCSARTVANQVGSILRKLGVGSRYELVARLGQPAELPGP
jgi:DNA-binding CsgD family transcriptional regulator